MGFEEGFLVEDERVGVCVDVVGEETGEGAESAEVWVAGGGGGGGFEVWVVDYGLEAWDVG